MRSGWADRRGLDPEIGVAPGKDGRLGLMRSDEDGLFAVFIRTGELNRQLQSPDLQVKILLLGV